MSGEKRIHATARVQVTVEIDTRDGWGGDCTVDQVHRQAGEMATNRLRAMLKDGARIVGEPRVVVVTTEVER